MKKTVLPIALLAFTACGGDGDNPDIPVQNLAVVVAGDFQVGSPGVMSALDLDTMEVEQRVAPTGAIAEDPVMRRFGGELFVVNRAGGNNVTILDATTFELVEQLATGEGSNPQDVAIVGGNLYVPALGTAGVIVVERGTGATRMIDLSELDPDGLPDCVSAFAVGTRVFVACGLLDELFTARREGVVAVIETADDDAVSFLDLTHPNPFGLFERRPDNDELVISTVSFADLAMGCVERIDAPATGAPSSLGCGATNDEIFGFAARIAFQQIDGEVIQWMAVTSFDADFNTIGRLTGHNLTDNTLIIGTSPETQVIVDLAVCRDQQTIIVSDATLGANGLRAYSNDIEVTTAPLAIGLKPGSHGLDCF